MPDTIETIDDLGHKAVTTPDELTVADRVRLGAWVVDHAAHIAAYKQDAAPPAAHTTPVPNFGEAKRPSELGTRLAASDPNKQIEAAAEKTP